MASHGIRDRVAIVGMGCTPFREHWDLSLDDLLIDAAGLALDSAGVAFAFGTFEVKPADVHTNLRRMVNAGLAPDAALATPSRCMAPSGPPP